MRARARGLLEKRYVKPKIVCPSLPIRTSHISHLSPVPHNSLQFKNLRVERSMNKLPLTSHISQAILTVFLKYRSKSLSLWKIKRNKSEKRHQNGHFCYPLSTPKSGLPENLTYLNKPQKASKGVKSPSNRHDWAHT